jgi:NAD(P)-dependent dehydrogenase (short-subunit alcohol dehydrogenase family)
MQTGAALVTGGAKRIGRAIVEQLAREGLAIAVHYRHSRDDAHDLVARIEAEGGRACAICADLGDSEAVARIVPEANAALGPLTLLVNNASEYTPDAIGAMDVALWNRQFSVNLRAPVFLAEAFAAQLPADVEGLIVNLIDQRVWKPIPEFFSYQLTKSALFTATQTLAQTLAPRIRVMGVGPGPVLPSIHHGQADFEREVREVLLQRGPSPAEIADAVAFLRQARSMTGHMIVLDGGQHLVRETCALRQAEIAP